MTKQSVTVNVHNPRVQGITRYMGDASLQTQMHITLGNDEYHGTVTLFMTDNEWNALVAEVEEFRCSERQNV